MSQIICVGSVSKDIFFPTGDGILIDTPDDIEAQQKVMFEAGAKYQVEDRFEAPGGVAANCAQGLARLGLSVGCYSRIGSDQMGDWVLNELQQERVDVSLVERDPDAWTDLSAIIVLMQTGDRTIFFNRDANEKLVVETEKLSGAEWLSVSALNGNWRDNLRTLLEMVRKEKLLLAFNPGQHNIKEDSGAVVEALKETSLLTVNKDEAIALVRFAQPETVVEQVNDERFLIGRLHAMGAHFVGLTDGLRGAWASDGTSIFHTEAGETKTVLDTTGAGDAFGSAFLAAHIKGYDIETMLQWGVANGGNTVRYYGAREGLLRENEIILAAEKISPRAL